MALCVNFTRILTASRADYSIQMAAGDTKFGAGKILFWTYVQFSIIIKTWKVKMSVKVISKVWDVTFSRSAGKQHEKLKRNGSRPSIADIVNFLTAEMELDGPYRSNWSNYGPLDGDKFHCHLKKGKPTYVACWRVTDKDNKKIKVYYVGTHENAPY